MIPHASERIPEWRQARQSAGTMLVALDFDGTLAPIVPIPTDAALPPATREALHRLAARRDTAVAVVSGRSLADLRPRIRLEDLYYGGNHGMELEGPGLDPAALPDLEGIRPAVRGLLGALAAALAPYQGVFIEDKGVSVSVHYRPVAASLHDEVRDVVHATVHRLEGMRSYDGKKVVNVVPRDAWDKGSATRHLLDALAVAEGGARAPAIFVGDDLTDEDAFRALRGRGDGVVVAPEPPTGTAATAWLRSLEEVTALIEALARD